MKIFILLIVISSFACTRTETANTNAANMEYKEPARLTPPVNAAEQAKHEKWKLEREAYLKKVNDLEKKRLDAIRKCEADRRKPKPANSESEVDDSQLSCEEQHPPIVEKEFNDTSQNREQ